MSTIDALRGRYAAGKHPDVLTVDNAPRHCVIDCRASGKMYAADYKKQGPSLLFKSGVLDVVTPIPGVDVNESIFDVENVSVVFRVEDGGVELHADVDDQDWEGRPVLPVPMDIEVYIPLEDSANDNSPDARDVACLRLQRCVYRGHRNTGQWTNTVRLTFDVGHPDGVLVGWRKEHIDVHT